MNGEWRRRLSRVNMTPVAAPWQNTTAWRRRLLGGGSSHYLTTQSAVLVWHVFCLSVRPSVTLVDCDNMH